jgi:hypothetical protein
LIYHFRNIGWRKSIIWTKIHAYHHYVQNIEQAYQEYPSKDDDSNGQKLEEQAQWSSMGIPNGLQTTDRYDTISVSLREDLSSSHGTWTQRFLVYQEVEHGPQGGQNQKKNLDCRTWGMEGKGLPQFQAVEGKNKKVARQANQEQAIQAGT